MADSIRTVQLHNWLARIRAGDSTARDELIRGVAERLEHLARKMLKGFPRVRRWEDTVDVMQNATLRLLRALEQVKPDSMRAFHGLAAEQIRRELLDLARHYYGKCGLGANHASVGPSDAQDARCTGFEAAAEEEPAAELERWRRFHEEVEKLPVAEREVVGLTFYHGWSQAEVAECLGVTVRTVQRHWQSALVKLHGLLKEVGE